MWPDSFAWRRGGADEIVNTSRPQMIEHDRDPNEPGTYIIRGRMHHPLPRAEVFAFFSDAHNLEVLFRFRAVRVRELLPAAPAA